MKLLLEEAQGGGVNVISQHGIEDDKVDPLSGRRKTERLDLAQRSRWNDTLTDYCTPTAPSEQGRLSAHVDILAEVGSGPRCSPVGRTESACLAAWGMNRSSLPYFSMIGH